MKRAHQILTRHPENPIIRPSDIDGAMAVFNPGPAMYQGKTFLYCRYINSASPLYILLIPANQ